MRQRMRVRKRMRVVRARLVLVRAPPPVARQWVSAAEAEGQ
jgi:hypothetical protein